MPLILVFCKWFWWRQLAEGRNLNCASWRGGWGERSCPKSDTAIHAVAVDRTPNLRGHFTTELLLILVYLEDLRNYTGFRCLYTAPITNTLETFVSNCNQRIFTARSVYHKLIFNAICQTIFHETCPISNFSWGFMIQYSRKYPSKRKLEFMVFFIIVSLIAITSMSGNIPMLVRIPLSFSKFSVWFLIV